MNKLTIEQRDWLIERFKKAFGTTSADLMGITPERVREGAISIISQCTEQEFPAYRYHATYTHAEYEVVFDFLDVGDIRIVMHATKISNERERADIRFDVNDFKEFTEGCNRIVEWLDNANR